MQKILLVAPAMLDISSPEEIESITSEHHATTVTGYVTSNRIHGVVTGNRYDIVHIASHSSEEGVSLSGEEIMGPSELARIARLTRARLVFLNSCRSASLGQFLINRGVPSVICTSVDIDDPLAWSIANHFYEELSENQGDYRMAFDLARDDRGVLIWLSNGNYMDKSMESLKKAIESVGEKVAENGESIRHAVLQRVGLGVFILLAWIFLLWRLL